MATETQNKIEAARRRYDDLAGRAAKLAKDDKRHRAAIEAEVKQKLKSRLGDRDKLMADKGAAHRELHALKLQREGEIVAGVDAGEITPADAKAELTELGHTPASAEIQIRRAMGRAPATEAPSAPSGVVEAPLPPRDEPRTPPEELTPLRVDDPISSQLPESQTVTYTDPSPDAK